MANWFETCVGSIKSVNILSFFVFCTAWCLRKTYRFEYFGTEHYQQSLDETGSILLALWHENILGGILGHVHRGFHPLASLSSDGQLISEVLLKFGFRPLRGSSSKGALAARRQILDALKTGTKVAVTVDGPRGPRHQAKRGLFDLAKNSGVGILPMSVNASSAWVLEKSWDSFKIPKPFAKIKISYLPLLKISAETPSERFNKLADDLRRQLNNDF